MITKSSRLSNSEFLKKLEALFDMKRENGTVFLEQKRLTPLDVVEEKHKPKKDSLYDIDPTVTDRPLTYQLLLRAKIKDRDDKRIKISTVVDPDRVDEFWKSYMEVLKSHMVALKKKDKKKDRKKKKSRASGKVEK